MQLEIPYDGTNSSERLDRFVARVLPDMSRARIQQAIREGHVTVHQNQEKSSYRLRRGDLVMVALPPQEIEPVGVAPEPIPLDILHEDDHLIVINKPANMIVHPAPGVTSGTLVNALLHHFDRLSQVAGQLRPGIVHRLDKDTTGVMVVAKSNAAHDNLSAQLAAREMKKTYGAMVYGAPRSEGTIDAPVGRHPVVRTKMAVVDNVRRGREALSRYWTIESLPGMARVRVQIETGRTHQIRVHMAHIGCPVVGDRTYGPGKRRPKEIAPSIWEEFIEPAVDGLTGQALHAERLELTHPATDKVMEFSAPWHDDMALLLERCKALGKQEGQGD